MADLPFFRVHRSAILPALDAVIEAVDQRSQIPILGNVLLLPRDGDLMLRATDLAIEVETSCDLLDAGSKTAITVAGADLREIVKNLPENAEISFSAGTFGDQVRIQSGRSRFSLLTLPEGDLPSIADKVKGQTVALEMAPLIDAIGKVLYAVKEDKTRPYLSGVCLHPSENGGLSVVGSDGHNLAAVQLDAGQALNFPSIIVPVKSVKAIKKLFGETKGRAEVTISDVSVRFVVGGVTLISKLVEGNFPGYQRIIPPRGEHFAVTPAATLKAAVSRVCVVANDLEKDTVRLRLEPGSMKVAMKSTVGEDADEEIPVDYDGDAIDIGFNGKYLTLLLGSITTQDVEMHFTDPASPGLFRPAIECSESYVIGSRKG